MGGLATLSVQGRSMAAFRGQSTSEWATIPSEIPLPRTTSSEMHLCARAGAESCAAQTHAASVIAPHLALWTSGLSHSAKRESRGSLGHIDRRARHSWTAGRLLDDEK